MRPLIIYQKLTEDKIDTFIQMRINQLLEEGATEDVDLTPALRDYYVRHMADGFNSCLFCSVQRIICYSSQSISVKREKRFPSRSMVSKNIFSGRTQYLRSP